jgi:hypothetical protein
MRAMGRQVPVPAGNASERRGAVAAVPVENDCEDQGFSSAKDGCSVWPCVKEPLVKWSLGWRCSKCGGCY